MSDKEVARDLMLLKLDSGEEVIGKVAILEGAYEIVQPIGVKNVVNGQDGRVSLELYPFMAFANDATVMIMTSHIQAIAVPDEGLSKYYLETIGDTPQIVVPDKKIILS